MEHAPWRNGNRNRIEYWKTPFEKQKKAVAVQGAASARFEEDDAPAAYVFFCCWNYNFKSNSFPFLMEHAPWRNGIMDFGFGENERTESTKKRKPHISKAEAGRSAASE